ncbi:hypothetical protein OB2597_00630 [Pseudooceanicola batsensis HTCC2597]|uniref:Orc1-like AAA ATPase domain-containing protein n=1 Tax=Pseudooceanicola batsensis (strain ATCC BAA-863 / DSM 15984 / KCTC 12145 / HTCC2597) TaxID=252305 RepID=A3U1U3_PSEBH|nr:hypothetical protein [Pseudooceanicola batsensis]EAQ01877.1 hypothetical protein OB2597_00630 [Pseudooceanicola batsensis HTCC2597]
MQTDLWHFPRTEFRDAVLSLFLRGGADALTLFGPRRTGKTQFLIHDIAPEAARRGLTVVYVSYWQAPEPPAIVTAHAIRAVLETPGLWTRTRAALQQMRPRLRVAPMGIGGEIDVPLGQTDRPPAAALLKLDDLLGELPASPEKPALLLLDEVQELARPEHRDFVAGLRTSLDKRRPAIKAVFTGSSLDGLQALFSAREAPFLQYGLQETMPPLGMDFVAHILKAQKAASGRAADLTEAMAFFEEVGRSPYAFRRALETMALRPGLGLREAHAMLVEDYAERQGYPRIWADLAPLPRAVLLEIARGGQQLTSTAAREAFAKALGEETVSKGRVSGALQTLTRNRLVHKLNGRWVAQDPEFARYLRHQETAG